MIILIIILYCVYIIHIPFISTTGNVYYGNRQQVVCACVCVSCTVYTITSKILNLPYNYHFTFSIMFLMEIIILNFPNLIQIPFIINLNNIIQLYRFWISIYIYLPHILNYIRDSVYI